MFAFLINEHTFNSNKINKTHTVLWIPFGRIVIWFYFQYKNNTWATSSDSESQHLLGSRTTNKWNNPQIDFDSRTTDFDKFFEFTAFTVLNKDQGNSVRSWTICMNSVNKIITSLIQKPQLSTWGAFFPQISRNQPLNEKSHILKNVNMKQKQMIFLQ